MAATRGRRPCSKTPPAGCHCSSDLVVYQGTGGGNTWVPAGPIIVSDGAGVRKFVDGERALVLHDVGHVDGRATMLVSSSAPVPVGPVDADHRLLLIDAVTFEPTDLGSFGGWESGVVQGRFGDDAISLLRSANTSNWVEVIELDGTTRFDVELASDRNWSLVDLDSSVWALQPRFVGDEFEPLLTIRQIDLTTGEVRDVDPPLSLEGVTVPAGFCDTADFLAEHVVCDQSSGPPLRIDIDDEAQGRTTAIEGLEDGTVRFRASQ